MKGPSSKTIMLCRTDEADQRDNTDPIISLM